MSQQAMFPESQGEHSQDNEEYKPYYWSTTPVAGKGKTGDILKNEHPATFEDTIPPYSYPAQEQMSRHAESQHSNPAGKRERSSSNNEYQRKQHTRQQQFNAGGQAYEYGSQPFMQQPYYMAQQVPSWARPQRNNRGAWRVIVLMILGFILLKPLVFVAIHLLAGIGILFGIAALAIIVPIIFALVLGAFAVLALLGVLSVFGLSVRRRRRRFWGGPWGW